MSSVTRCEWAAGGDELMRRLPRRGVGRAVARRPPSLRDADARGRAGRALVVDDPAQARGLPAGVRRLRPCDGRRASAPKDVERLLADPGIVRNRLKVESAVEQRGRVLEVQDELGSLDAYLWALRRRRADRQPLAQRSPSSRPRPSSRGALQGPEATRLPLRRADGIYAFMQTVGMVDDHTVDCFRFATLSDDGSDPVRPQRRRQHRLPGHRRRAVRPRARPRLLLASRDRLGASRLAPLPRASRRRSRG